ncbi:ABC transporter ATP-binding protein [Cohnella faecalis]|uniref:ABC transporter ATP-binding protein n=1 Tax=Cohnella faecalis TaxID=2315694 RepID=A0A398CR99_9BACL|nr:ABC transporter ATP-binding protein [Cohnella faecalis]RIE03789.1 ABC transporter ATP-binding protein [Cohnella faecalis]
MEPIWFFIRRLYEFTGNKILFNVSGMVFVSFLEGLGIVMLVPMLTLSGMSGLQDDEVPLAKWFGFIHEIPAPWVLPAILGLFVLVVTTQSFLKRQVTLQNIKINQSFDLATRTETYRLLLQANWDFFIKRRKSDMISSLTSEIARINGGITLSLQLLATVIYTMIQIGLAFWLSPEVTAFVLASGIVLALFSRKFIRRAKKLGTQSTELARLYLAGITDQMNGIKDIKTHTLEYSRLGWMRAMSSRVLQEQSEFIKLKTTTQFFYQIASAILISGFILLSVQIFHTPWAQLLLIVIIFTRLWPRFTGFQSNVEQIASFYPAYKNVLRLQQECREAAEFAIGDEADHPVRPLEVKTSLECRDVSFRYNRQDERFALQNIDLEIPANRMTAIVGKSGAGKSTLIDLFMGLMLPEVGQVVVDGVPLTNAHLVALRRSISYVPQDPFLFNDTIRENLLMVKPGAEEGELWEALDFAACSEFVRKLPKGLDTFIGDRGVRLSGGERQRLVLARAILRKPSVLVLDEATSALDTENESKIQEAIERLKGKMTIIVIAHRLSTIRNADQVVVIDQGRIVQRGRFGQLAKDKRNLFSHLLGNQSDDESNAEGEERIRDVRG